MKKRILANNTQDFLDDLNSVTDYLVYSHLTKSFFRIRRGALLKEAEEKHISYYLSNEILVSKRMAMVII